MKMNRHLITVLATGAGLVASFVLAFKAGMKAEEILREEDPDGELNFLQKATKVAPTLAPAAGAAVLTGAGIAAEFFGREKEFKAAENTIKKLENRKERIKKDFEGYRETLAKTDSKEKDVEIAMATASPSIDPTNEATHVFKIDWMGDDKQPIYFETSYKRLYDGLNSINQYIVDRHQERDYAVVSDLFDGMGLPSLKDDDTDAAGWSSPILAKECEAYWIDWTFETVKDHPNGQEVIEIIPSQYPNFNIEQYINELEARGAI